MSSTTSSPRTSLSTGSMTTFLSQTPAQAKRWRALCRRFLKTILVVTSSWRTVLSIVSSQGSFTWSKRQSSFTLTKSWTSWLRQSWFKTSSTFLKVQDTSWHPRVTFLWLEATILRPRSSLMRLTFSTSIGHFLSHLMACFTQGLNT